MSSSHLLESIKPFSLSSLLVSATTPRCLAEKSTMNRILQSSRSFRKPLMAALLFSCLFLALPFGSFAASGGRMGGSFFPSPPPPLPSSSPPPSTSRCSHHHHSCSHFSSDHCCSCSHSYSRNHCCSCSRSRSRSCSSSPETAKARDSSCSSSSGETSKPSDFNWALLAVPLIAAGALVAGVFIKERRDSMIHIHKIQVGLFCPARSIRRELNLIAETADTSKKIGLKAILTESSIALLRLLDRCIYVHSSVDSKRTNEDAEISFSKHSIEERVKLDGETLVNFNNFKKHILLNKTTNDKKTNDLKEYTVVTILVVVAGSWKLPVLNNVFNLKDALNKLSAIPISQTLAAEVIWTPQSENDSLSESEMLKAYPLLKPLEKGYTVLTKDDPILTYN
ncbi:Growth factor receptor cysteine-rich domain-containing protein [Dioscorea alata]|uniref:Growth factor receptor cysteine-rich domain-containing protein n=1 Tax=Dioscorea alata TaxID=55571 RepID=A0ACB7UY14_DIOAL|nr:Growth factor receptor cysteine-rich domain-containing protein [Dioscorea alata]